jgi:hypothetical protein
MRTLPVVVLALVALGCGGGQAAGNAPQPDGPAVGGAEVSGKGAPPRKVIVTRDDASLPEGCNTR